MRKKKQELNGFEAVMFLLLLIFLLVGVWNSLLWVNDFLYSEKSEEEITRSGTPIPISRTITFESEELIPLTGSPGTFTSDEEVKWGPEPEGYYCFTPQPGDRWRWCNEE